MARPKSKKSTPNLAPPVLNVDGGAHPGKSSKTNKNKNSRSKSSSPVPSSKKKLSEVQKVKQKVSKAFNKLKKTSKKGKKKSSPDDLSIDQNSFSDLRIPSDDESEVFRKDQIEPVNEDSGFIAFDSDFSDVADSIHTTFKSYEDEISLWADSEEEEEQERQEREQQEKAREVSNGKASTDTGPRKRKRTFDDTEDQMSKRINVSAEFPWVVNHDHSHEKEIADWLTLEIKDFVSYMSPSAGEIIARNNAVQKVRSLVKELWLDADIHVFGSFATDLYLPGSDIDMVVLSKSGLYDDRAHLYKLSSKLRASGIATKMTVVAKARVPIIKFVEKESSIPIDISFERRNGVEAVQIIRKWTEEFPCTRYLAIIIKHFLARRKMNEVHTGGLGGFSVVCLIVSFLKNHPKVASGSIDPINNLGVLLIEFFELYGRNFNYDSLALCMRDDMRYLRKDQHPDLENDQRKFTLAIQDPSDESNNLSRGTFNIRGIKKAFSGAFDLLIAKCYELEDLSFRDRVGKSILGNVIKFRGPERDFVDSRSEVQSEYELNIDNYMSNYGDSSRDERNDDTDDIIVPSDFEEEMSVEDLYERDEGIEKATSSVKVKVKSKLRSKNSSKSSSRSSSPKSSSLIPKKSNSPLSANVPQSAKKVIEYYNISESDSDEESKIGNTPSAPIILESDSDSEQDSRVSTVDKGQKRDYWLSKGSISN